MELHAHVIIIILSSIVILSYFFTLISNKTNIPSVLLLISTGIGIKYLSAHYGYVEKDVDVLVKTLGAIGLIMIILEAALDLDVHKKKITLVRNSFLSALFIFLASALAIAYLLQSWLYEPFMTAFVYAIPMSIISSAIVIPSTNNLPHEKKEFIIYESSFSDILGIMVFNYFLMDNVLSFSSSLAFLGRVGLAIAVSILASVLLVYLLSKMEHSLKYFLVFAILSIVYASGELIHLPALLIVLVFGLVLNNSPKIVIKRYSHKVPLRKLIGVIDFMKSITAETSFLIRTFFFILFGYTINLRVLIEPDVVFIGSIIVAILLFIRFLYLRLILKTNLFPEIFLMPRGLVTILLFYSIPASKKLSTFNVGILFYVVVLTSIIMAIGLIFYKKEDKARYLKTTEENAI
ncbi:MAG: cation:proton antiporter [Flavipsychrobacter sp.]